MNKTAELELKIAQIIMTILPGYWNLPATPGRDFDADWAELAANCKELCLSRARGIVELLKIEWNSPEDNIQAILEAKNESNV